MKKFLSFFVFSIISISLLLYVVFNFIIRTSFEININLKNFDELNQSYNKEFDILKNNISLNIDNIQFDLSNILIKSDQQNYILVKRYNGYLKKIDNKQIEIIEKNAINLVKNYTKQLIVNHFKDYVGIEASNLSNKYNQEILDLRRILISLDRLDSNNFIYESFAETFTIKLTDINQLEKFLINMIDETELLNYHFKNYNNKVEILLKDYFENSENFIFTVISNHHKGFDAAIFLLLINFFGLFCFYIVYKKALNGNK